MHIPRSIATGLIAGLAFLSLASAAHAQRPTFALTDKAKEFLALDVKPAPEEGAGGGDAEP